MKMRKNKGKIHPSPSQSSPSTPPSSSSIPNQNALSVLTLLPAAILALISVLSIEDKEVFAYMVTRSMKSSSSSAVNPSSCSIAADQEKNKKKNSNKKLLLSTSSSIIHKPPVFDCECFDCYTSYWFRWDSSPNKELIHKAIEEFEEHLFSQEQVKRSSSNKGKKREKIGRLVKEKPVEERELVSSEESFVVGVPENEVFVVGVPENEAAAEEEVVEAATVEEGRDVAVSENKGFVRKVLPDVVGILNSRLWGLWSPNV